MELEELVGFRARIQARGDGDFHHVVPVSLRRGLYGLLYLVGIFGQRGEVRVHGN